MEKFLGLSGDKQNKIINSALACFGTNGYRKTSISDIASAAGISKSMIFHYFGTKKSLYLYLAELCGNLLTQEITERFDRNVTDFFDRIRLATNIKIAVIKKYPFILTFMTSVYFETDEEVRPQINSFLEKGEEFRVGLVGMDDSKFKDGIDPKLVMKMLTWIAEGYISELPSRAEIDIQSMSEEFNECLLLLRSNFYKEEEI